MARITSTSFVFQPVQLVRPAELVAYRIAEAIRAGDVRVGERLPPEQTLSTQLGVSRPTLREAVKLLAEAGVLKVLPGSAGGIFVTSESVPAQLSGLPLPELQLEDIAGVLEARRLIEPMVARMAAVYATPADFAAMHDAVRLSEQTDAIYAGRKPDDAGLKILTIASTRFNLSVARATQNSVIVQMMDILLRRMVPVREMALRDLPDVTVSTRTLANSLAAIESGDPELIDASTAVRIGFLESAWERASGRRLRRRETPPAAAGSRAHELATALARELVAPASRRRSKVGRG
jgi:GntR family transcriptional repressor for pyruvate dehydrogenase complex